MYIISLLFWCWHNIHIFRAKDLYRLLSKRIVHILLWYVLENDIRPRKDTFDEPDVDSLGCDGFFLSGPREDCKPQMLLKKVHCIAHS